MTNKTPYEILCLMAANDNLNKNTKWILLTIVLIVLFFAGISYFSSTNMNNKPYQPTPKPTTVQSSIPVEEQKKIDQWIENNNLNQYGDPKDTVYAGGTPLFNESTGEYTDKYEYIVKEHPDRPWNK